MPLAPSRQEAERFVAALTGSLDAPLTFQTFPDAKDSSNGLPPLVLHGSLAERWDDLVRANVAGHGVFVMVNRGDGDGRRAENVCALRALFVDDDSGELAPAALGLTPSIIVQSKGGLHVYWRLRDGELLDRFTPAQVALATHLGTDPAVKDLPRVMRVPGLFHVKDRSDPFLVTVVQAADVAYSVAEVLDGLGVAEGQSVAPSSAPGSWSDTAIVTGDGDGFRRAQAAMTKRDHAVEGGRNAAAFGTACYLGDFALSEAEAFDLLRVWNHGNKPPLEESELRTILVDAIKYRSQPEGVRLGLGATGNGATSAAKPSPTPQAAIVPVRLRLDDIRNPPHEEFVIGNMIPFAKSSVIYGPTSVGKSAAIAQVAFAFAAGAETLWGLPLFPGGGPVLVYTAEDSLDDWKRKAAAVLHAGGIDMARALERFYVVDQSEGVARLSEVVTVRNGDATESTSKRIAQPTEEQDRLVEAARSIKARFIVVETASRLVEDEDNAAFSGLQSALGRIGRETGAAVTVTHHATKAASKENDSGIESARGGGALVYNARNALALFPAEPDAAKDYADRFPAEDVFVLTHGKPTSSTRRQAPIVLVRCDAVHGAVFRRPDEVVFTPEQATANAAKLEREREREIEQLRRLYDAVAKALPTRPGPSPSWIRDNLRSVVGVTEKRLEWLVGRAVAGGILQVVSRTDRGVRLGLGVDPSRPIDDSARVCPSREEDEP